MKTHFLIQGTPAWQAYRREHFNASDAAAMMGVSPYMTRSELLHQMHTGLAKDVDPATQRRFDAGHAAEAAARPLAEEIIGEEIYPVTGSEGKLSASFDGLTMSEGIVWEHKLMNVALLESLAKGIIPEQYYPQLEQQLMVSGAEKALFMATSPDKTAMERVWYTSNPELREAILQGWTQFAIDLAAYTPTAPTVQAVAAPVESLPAVWVLLDGQLVVASNLPEFAVALKAFIANIPAKPSTDQEFADCEAACKSLKKAEDALESSEAHALAQMTDVEAMRRMVADLRNLARATRLASEKSVAARKESIRIEIVNEGAAAMKLHLTALNARLGRSYMPAVPVDFAGAIKGKRTVDSLRDAVSTTLANAKIAASAIADKIDVNLRHLSDVNAPMALFSDLATICLKADDDFVILVKSRIDAEATRIEALAETARDKIRQEEADKLAAKAITTAQATPVPAPVVAQAVVTHDAVVKIMMPATVAQAMKPATPPTLKLGQIGTRLGFNLTADFITTLGFEPAGRKRSAVLFHESDFPRICEALVQHINEVCQVAA